MDALVIKVEQSRESITGRVYRTSGNPDNDVYLGDLYLTVKDLEWLVLANTSESTTPFIVEVKGG